MGLTLQQLQQMGGSPGLTTQSSSPTQGQTMPNNQSAPQGQKFTLAQLKGMGATSGLSTPKTSTDTTGNQNNTGNDSIGGKILGGIENAGKAIYQGVASPVINMLARPGQAVTHALGNNTAQEGDVFGVHVNDPYSDVERGESVSSALGKDVGRGIETVAVGLNPAAGGAAFGAGNSMEQGNNLLSGQTALEAGTGLVGGKALEFGSGLLGKGLGKVVPQGVQDYTKGLLNDTFGKASDVVNKITGNTSKGEVSGLINKTAEKINNTADAPFKKAGDYLQGKAVNSAQKDWNTQAKTKESREILQVANEKGITSPDRFLAERGIDPVKVMGNNNQIQVADSLRTEASKLDKSTISEALKVADQSTPPTTIEELRQKALSNIDPKATVTDKQALVEKINSETEALKQKYPKGMTLTDMDGEKGIYDSNTRFGVNEDSTFKGRTNRTMGSAMRGMIEDKAKGIPVGEMNKYLSQYYQAADFLDSLEGKPHRAGLLRKGLQASAKLAGATAGHALTGGVGGDLGGYLAGSYFSHAFDNFSSPLKSLMLKNLKISMPEAYDSIIKYLGEQEAQKVSRLALPEGKPLGSSENPIITPSPTIYEKPAQKINRQETKGLLNLPAGTNRANPSDVINLPPPIKNESQAEIIRRYSLNPKNKKVYQKGLINGGNK